MPRTVIGKNEAMGMPAAISTMPPPGFCLAQMPRYKNCPGDNGGAVRAAPVYGTRMLDATSRPSSP